MDTFRGAQQAKNRNPKNVHGAAALDCRVDHHARSIHTNTDIFFHRNVLLPDYSSAPSAVLTVKGTVKSSLVFGYH